MFVATFMTSARKALSLGLVLLLATASFAQEAGSRPKRPARRLCRRCRKRQRRSIMRIYIPIRTMPSRFPASLISLRHITLVA